MYCQNIFKGKNLQKHCVQFLGEESVVCKNNYKKKKTCALPILKGKKSR